METQTVPIIIAARHSPLDTECKSAGAKMMLNMIKMNSCTDLNEIRMSHTAYLRRVYARKRVFHFWWFVTFKIFSSLNIKNQHFVCNSISCSYQKRYWTESLCPWILASTHIWNWSMANWILTWTSRRHIFSSFCSNSRDWNGSQLFL